MSTTTDELKFLTPKVIVKYLKKNKKRNVDHVWMFRNKMISHECNFNGIRARGNKYSVLLKLRNYILKESYECNDIFTNHQNYSYYMDEKDDTIYSYLNTNFFSSSDISLLEMIKIPKELTYI